MGYFRDDGLDPMQDVINQIAAAGWAGGTRPVATGRATLGGNGWAGQAIDALGALMV